MFLFNYQSFGAGVGNAGEQTNRNMVVDGNNEAAKKYAGASAKNHFIVKLTATHTVR